MRRAAAPMHSAVGGDLVGGGRQRRCASAVRRAIRWIGHARDYACVRAVVTRWSDWDVSSRFGDAARRPPVSSDEWPDRQETGDDRARTSTTPDDRAGEAVRGAVHAACDVARSGAYRVLARSSTRVTITADVLLTNAEISARSTIARRTPTHGTLCGETPRHARQRSRATRAAPIESPSRPAARCHTELRSRDTRTRQRARSRHRGTAAPSPSAALRGARLGRGCRS